MAAGGYFPLLRFAPGFPLGAALALRASLLGCLGNHLPWGSQTIHCALLSFFFFFGKGSKGGLQRQCLWNPSLCSGNFPASGHYFPGSNFPEILKCLSRFLILKKKKKKRLEHKCFLSCDLTSRTVTISGLTGEEETDEGDLPCRGSCSKEQHSCQHLSFSLFPLPRLSHQPSSWGLGHPRALQYSYPLSAGHCLWEEPLVWGPLLSFRHLPGPWN